jgi:hypothetical protein
MPIVTIGLPGNAIELSSGSARRDIERALQNNKAAAVYRKFHGERKIGQRSQMGA